MHLTGHTEPYGPEFFQTEAERLDDLARDLDAIGFPAGGAAADAVLAAHPSVLRRCARLLARRVPAGTERLIAAEDGAVPLAAAVAAETELPHEALPTGSAVVRERPRARWKREAVALVRTVFRADETLASALRLVQASGHRCVGALAVAGTPAPDGCTGRALFPDGVRSGPLPRPGAAAAPATVPAAPAPGVGRADATRISALLDEFATLSEPGDGVTRLAYSALERTAHEVFAVHMRKLGIEVRTDPAGNSIAELPGDAPAPAIGTGSHLDSVPNGGRFDGAAGVVAAMEVARLLVESGRARHHPFRFVAFAAEEGARFGSPCLGSKLAAGVLPQSTLRNADSDGVPLAEAMTALEISPDDATARPWRREEWAAFVELHVEQGGVLDAAGLPIGVVDSVSGSTRLSLTLRGQASHSGATPMELRADALPAAAEVVLCAEQAALSPGREGCRATVGRLDVAPGSLTTVPGLVTMTLDVRDTDADRQRSTVGGIVQSAFALCRRRGVELGVEVLGDTSPVLLPLWLRRSAADCATALGLPHRVMTSGAGHDAQIINRVAPSAIVFVPSRGGLSHVPEEWSGTQDIARGTDVLLATLLAADSHFGAAADSSAHGAPVPHRAVRLPDRGRS